jgi:O-antigen ligase
MIVEYIFGSIALGGFFFSLLVNKSDFRFRISKYEILIVTYLVLAVISGIINHSTGLFYRTMRTAIPLEFGLLYIYAFSRKDWKYIIYGLTIFGMANVFMSYWIFISNVSGIETPLPVSALYGNRNIFTKYLSIISAYFLIEFLLKRDKGKKFIHGVLLIAIFWGILIQYSRSGYVEYFITSTIIIFSGGSKSVKRVALFILPMVLALFAYFTIVRIQTEKMNIVNGSDIGRIYVLKAGINMIRAHPIRGIGYGMSESRNSEFAIKSLPGLNGLTAIHNWFIVVWAEMGILGLIVFCALNYTLMHKSIQSFLKLGLFEGKQSFFVFNSLLILIIEAFVQPISDYQDIYWIIVAIGVIYLKSAKNTLQNIRTVNYV